VLPVLPCDLDDRYTLTAELGRGSHAIVYRATDRHLQREVAVKVLREELLGSDVSERFQREIRLTARLEHPNIAHVYGTGEYMGTPYFVIALARGTTLGERLTHERQLPIAEAVAIARQVASALQHAHAAGIIHRDVKPENILLTPDGALLSDFGIARALDLTPGTLATTTGTAVGTLLYMSPEQLCAEKDIDARSDQYALALVLYEMLAGVPAHVAANAEGLRGLRIVGQHAPLHTHRPTVPAHVEAAVHESLAPAPADRFTNMTAFIAALDDGRNSASFRISAANRIVQPVPAASPLRRWIAGGAVLAALATAGVMNADRLYPPTAAASMATPVMASSFTVVADGDTAVAAALATELGLWSPEIRATVAASRTATSGVVLETRVTAIPGGFRAAVQLRPARSSAAAGARVVQITLPAAAGPRADSLRLLAARVLIASRVSPDSIELPDVVLEHPIAALRSYGEGWASLLAGDLPKAEQSFADASRTRSLPQATLWQATVASWRQPRTPAAWRDVATAAQAAAPLLSPRDSLLAEALRHRAADRMPESCDAYTRATRLGGGSFASWYGLGECLQTDSVVVRDGSSPTGFRYRTSYWSALSAFDAAIQRLPSDRLVFLFDRLPRVSLAVNPSQRTGMLPGGGRMQGLPAEAGDSVVVFPLPATRMGFGGAGTIPATFQSAVRRARRRLLDLSTSLATRAPGSLGAHLMHARALEYAGVLDAPGPGATALSALRNAVSLAVTQTDSLQVSLAESRVLLRTRNFAGVAVVAGRLLASPDSIPPDAARRLLSLAIIADRPDAAFALFVRSNAASAQQPDGLPLPAASAVARYNVAASWGECDRIAVLRDAATASLRATFSPAELPLAEERYLASAEWMGLTCSRSPLPAGVPASDITVRAFAALRDGRRAEVGNLLRFMIADRTGAAETSVAWDTRFGEIWLTLQSGDTAQARSRLKNALNELPETMDFVLFDPAQGAGLRRSLQLCSALEWPPTEAAPGAVCRAALTDLTPKISLTAP